MLFFWLLVVSMTSKKMDSGSKDFINNLPDALVCHILSFLTTRDAALTSVLSRRWRYLLAFVPNLDLHGMFHDQPKKGRQRKIHSRQSFKLFVDRVMALQGNAPLNKFALKFKSFDPSQANGWVLKALDRGVAELDIFIASENDYLLPREVFMSKTLVRLKVAAGTDEFVVDVGEVSLPKLKSLYFNDVSFKDETGAAFAKLISACPALEELVMIRTSAWDQTGRDYWKSFVVSNASLKRVTICLEPTGDNENPRNVVFDTPSLVRLEYSDTVALKYLANFDSLVEASIGIQMTHDQVVRGRVNRHYLQKTVNVAGFLKGISNVKILYLSSQALEVLTLCCKAEDIPVFNNLIHLTIETDEDMDWESLPNLLKNCLNLETLVFVGLNYGDTNQCSESSDEGYHFKDTNRCFELLGRDGVPIWLSTSPVKTLKVLEFGKITVYKDELDRQVDLIKHFVETMPNLEQVILYWDTPFDDDLSIQLTEFHRLEKVASPKCKIQIISDNISYSSTVGSSPLTNGPVFFKNRFPFENHRASSQRSIDC